MGMINKYHLELISRGPVDKFCREKGITFSTYSFDELISSINQLVENGDIEVYELRKNLNNWIFQGRKKIVFKYLDINTLRKIRKYDILKDRIQKRLIRSTEIQNILELRPNVDEKVHFVDVEYFFDHKDKTKLSKVVFLYVRIVNYIKTEGAIRTEKPLALPVHITLDFENNEIHSRINAKTDIYDFKGKKIVDTDIAITTMEMLLYNLSISNHMDDIDRETIKRTIYKINEVITRIPDEIIESVEVIDLDCKEFINNATKKLEIGSGEESLKDINNAIKKIFIKELIKTYSTNEKDVFFRDNYAKSTSITASGESFSKLKHSSAGKDPIHSAPEYQNVKSFIDDTEIIDRSTIYWKSILKRDSDIRSKLFTDKQGYGIISFEQYAYEEDINHVFSKIRESKPLKII